MNMKEKSLGGNIKEIRIANNLTQKQFGEILGYAPRTVSDWEISKNEPSISTLKLICKKFNVSYDEILDY